MSHHRKSHITAAAASRNFVSISTGDDDEDKKFSLIPDISFTPARGCYYWLSLVKRISHQYHEVSFENINKHRQHSLTTCPLVLCGGCEKFWVTQASKQTSRDYSSLFVFI